MIKVDFTQEQLNDLLNVFHVALTNKETGGIYIKDTVQRLHVHISQSYTKQTQEKPKEEEDLFTDG